MEDRKTRSYYVSQETTFQYLVITINGRESEKVYIYVCIYFGHLMLRANSSEDTLILGKIKGKRRRGQKRMR